MEKLESRQLLAGDVTLFADSFESGSNSNDWAGNWGEDSQNDWFRSTQRSTQGVRSAEVDGYASNATLTISNSIDLSGYSSAELTFDWLIESGFDSGEYLALDVSNDGGASWTTSVLQLNGNSDPENQWRSETVDLTPFASSEVLVRFRAKVSRSNEDANVDNVVITGVEAGNQVPVADAGADQTLSDNDGTGSETVTFSGGGFDPDGSIVGYEWSDGAAVLGNTATISRSLSVGTHTLTLTVTDNEGASGIDTVVVTIEPGHTIDLSDFSDVSDLNLVGHATTTSDHRLRLTDAGLRQGSVWHDSKQAVSTSFETQFDFVTESSAQGLSFVIQNTRPEMLGGNPGYQGVPNSLVIDFDTRMQSNQNDPNDNHVSIQSRGREHNSSHHDFSLGTATVAPDMNDGQSHTAKIRFEAGILSVFVDDMASPVLSANIEIDALLDLEFGQAWVGFTSGNNRHELLSWQFRPLVDLSTAIGIHDAEILEGDNGTQQLVFQVQRSGPATASIQWSTVDDSAVAGDDYAAASGIIEFTNGGNDVQQVSISVYGDTTEEVFETFFVDLDITSGQATIVDDRAVGTILNDEAMVSINDASAIEGATGFTFSDEFVPRAIDGLWTMSRGLDFGPDGNLYVTVEQGPYPGAVLRYNGQTGDLMGAFATHNDLDGAKDIEFGPDGNLYVTNNRTDKILRFDGTSGEFIDVYVPSGGALNVPRAIVFGTDNNLYVANANSDEILRYQGPTGQNPGQLIDVFVSAGEGGMDSPTTLTFGPDGTLYVASGAHAVYNNSILRFDGTTGDFIDAFDVSGTSTLALVPTAGMIFGPDLNGDGVGELYASNGDGPAEVLAFDPTNGALLEKVVESGEGGLSDPKGLAFTPEGDLLVVSSATRNILRYSARDQAAFTATLSSPVGQTVEIDFATADGTAISGSDYVSTSGTLTIARGTTSQTFFVASIDDSAYELDETYLMMLTNALGATIADDTGVGTIIADGDVGNQAPTADAGADQTLSDNDGTGSEIVTLGGNGFDADGSIVAYEWSDGATVLGTAATISPSLSVGTHTLTLTVTDNEGATGSDTVVVTVDANQSPSAGAGADQSASDADGSGNQVVTLTGNGADSDGSIASYQWSEGATILGNAASVSPALSVGTHTLTFTVTDNGGAVASDSVVVTIVANQAPMTDAGSDQSISDGDDNGSEMVTISGSGSDVDGSIVSYQWTEGATVLGNTASISPSLSVGAHTLTLTVTDNGGASTSDDVVITIVEPANQDPTATAGADQTLSDNDGTGSETLTLVGSGSDPDGTIVSYQWTNGATVLGDNVSVSPSLTVGAHTLTLTVTDDDGATASDSLVVTVVANQGPSVNAGINQTVTDNDSNGSETVTLTGTASDSDGSIASYSWSDETSVIGTTASITPTLDVGTHTLILTVTDNGGATNSDTVTVTVEAAPASGPNLSHGNVASVGSGWQTVSLGKSYTSMVVVATPRYNDGSGPGVVRINNVTANSFDVRVDNAGSASFSGGIHYVAVEEGVYDEPGFKLEAVKYDEAQTSRRSGWGIDTVGYQQFYSSPVVVGQVMSANDEDWSVFWASSGSRTSPPSSSALNVGKHVAEDPDTTRATETIGYLVIEATQDGTIEGLPFVAGVGGDTVRGVGNGTNQYSYDAMPNAKTAVLSGAGMDGSDGGWAVLRGDNPVPASSGTISLSIDEDQLRDSERNHTTEQVAYFVIDPPLADSGGNVFASNSLAAVELMSSKDVNGDGSVSLLDALLIINRLKLNSTEEGDFALDTNQDDRITVLDALLVVNRLNRSDDSTPPERARLRPLAIDGYFATLDEEEDGLFRL